MSSQERSSARSLSARPKSCVADQGAAERVEVEPRHAAVLGEGRIVDGHRVAAGPGAAAAGPVLPAPAGPGEPSDPAHVGERHLGAQERLALGVVGVHRGDVDLGQDELAVDAPGVVGDAHPHARPQARLPADERALDDAARRAARAAAAPPAMTCSSVRSESSTIEDSWRP